MSSLISPHGGGDLRPLRLQGERCAHESARAQTLRKLRITSREKGDLVMLGIGGFTPLDGFMTRADWKGVCDDMRTADGVFWPIPITLSTDETTADAIAIGEDVALIDPDDDARARRALCQRKVPHRQGARVPVGLQDDRCGASGRADGDAAG